MEGIQNERARLKDIIQLNGYTCQASDEELSSLIYEYKEDINFFLDCVNTDLALQNFSEFHVHVDEDGTYDYWLS